MLVTRVEQARMLPPRRDGRMRRRVAFGTVRAAELNPLLSLVEDWIHSPAGYIEHLHRGFETLTLVYAGRLACTGSSGERHLLEAGALQWVTAGSEVTHTEVADGEDEVHLIQLWLNLPSALKRGPPRTLTLAADAVPTFELPGARVRAIAGEFDGRPGATIAGAQAQVLELRLEQGAALALPIQTGQRGLAYVARGELTAGSTSARAGDLIHFSGETPDALELSASLASHLLVVSAPPLAEPVVINGPFVMNTAAQIKQAWDEFRAKLPAARGSG